MKQVFSGHWPSSVLEKFVLITFLVLCYGQEERWLAGVAGLPSPNWPPTPSGEVERKSVHCQIATILVED